MAVNEVFFDKYPDAQLQHQIQVQEYFFTVNNLQITKPYLTLLT